MKVVIIGIGLIGGSFARDLREVDPGAEILGMDRDESHMTGDPDNGSRRKGPMKSSKPGAATMFIIL